MNHSEDFEDCPAPEELVPDGWDDNWDDEPQEKNIKIDCERPFNEMLEEVLALPKGTKIIRNGGPQTEDFPEFCVIGMREMGKELDPLPKAIRYGPPTDEEVTEALRCIYETKSSWFYINRQGNFLANAQKVSNFAADEPHYCFDTLMD